MANDVVEAVRGKLGLGQIGLPEVDVLEPKRANAPRSLADVQGRQVEAHEMGFWEPCRQGNDVASGGTAKFQDAGAVGLGWLQTVKRCQGGQLRRLGGGTGN